MICAIHGTEMVLKPAGTSKKTGKPYPAFWSCPEKNEDGSYCNFKPDRQGAYGQATPTPRIDAYFPEPPPAPARDYIWEGHVKGINNLAGSMLAAGKTPAEVLLVLQDLDKIVQSIDAVAKRSLEEKRDIPF